MDKYLIYNHASIVPVGIKIGEWYKFEDLKERFGLEYVTQFFKPTNFGWEEVEEIFPKKKDKK